MSERPLTDAEREILHERLAEAVETRDRLNLFIMGAEKELRRGTTWQYDPEAFERMCVEVEEIARKDTERVEKREIAAYGHILTHGERQGWALVASHKPRLEGGILDEGGA